jgi:hypothetical protein
MMLKKFGYAALVAAAAFAFALGSSSSGEAKGKKMAAPPPPQPQPCLGTYEPVCGKLKGQTFTYANACSAYKDGASVVSKGACAVKKAHKARKHKAAKHKAKKPMKKAAKKSAKKKM